MSDPERYLSFAKAKRECNKMKKYILSVICITILQSCYLSQKPSEGLKTVDEKIEFYLNKLKDKNYTSTYGDNENIHIWYTAAEELGRIGKPAIPYLINKLESNDPYELKLTLYALALASQDPEVKSKTNGEYVKLRVALSDSYNDENKMIAFKWWEKYKHIW